MTPRRFPTSFMLVALIMTISSSSFSQAPVRIGTVLPLSGPLVALGQELRAGIMAWVDETNNKGGLLGRRIELLIEDSGNSLPGAIEKLHILVDQKGVAAIVVPCCRIPSVELRSGVPVLYPIGPSFGRATPSWAQLSPAESANILQRGGEHIGTDFVSSRSTLRPLTNFLSRTQMRATHASVFAFQALSTFGDVAVASGSLQLAPSALDEAARRMPQIRPDVLEVNDPACDPGECRNKQTGKCQRPPC